MSSHIFAHTIKHVFQPKYPSNIINYTYTRRTSSTPIQGSNKERFRYIKYLAIAFGGTVTFSFLHQVYRWTIQVPICPNFHRNQNININNVLACTALVRDIDKQCSGQKSMKKIGAATGVNFKLIKVKSDNVSSSTKVILNDNDIIQCNIFDSKYILEYFETLVDLLTKLNENYCVRLLSNIIGYYICICPECHSSVTRQMISCTSYLKQAGLQKNAVDISETES